ncbi:hypothetical protein AERO9A_380089 [Aeromonas salmonicida]|nr:hypothetical protein AERO9A_380089 [Aeromonas salmonicida]
MKIKIKNLSSAQGERYLVQRQAVAARQRHAGIRQILSPRGMQAHRQYLDMERDASDPDPVACSGRGIRRPARTEKGHHPGSGRHPRSG